MPTESASCPWLGGDGAVVVRGLWLADLRRVSATITDAADQTFEIVALSVRDENGEQLATREQWHKLASLHRAEFADLNEAVRRVNGLDTDYVKND